MCLCRAINAPLSVLAGIGNGVGYSAQSGAADRCASALAGCRTCTLGSCGTAARRDVCQEVGNAVETSPASGDGGLLHFASQMWVFRVKSRGQIVK